MKKKTVIWLILLVMSMVLSGCGLKNPDLCQAKDCLNEHEEGAEYCREHLCQEEGCLNEKIGERFCEEHFSCALCDKERNGCEGALYCEDHSCGRWACPELKAKGHKYCEKHYCKAENCENETRADGDYCAIHGCSNCGKKYSGEFEYCDECRCDVAGCPNFGSPYCSKHECSRGECKKLRYNDTEYCYEHYQEKKKEEDERRKEEEERQRQYQEAINAKKDQVVVDSNGKKIWKVCMADNQFRFQGSYSGTGNFIVTVMDANQDYYASICNEIGDYVVDKTISVAEGEYYYIETFCSDGEWSASWWGTYGD